jgi:CspA family cold shock protein
MLMQGKVKWFNDAKGIGFIVGSDRDYFVHHSNIRMDGFRTLSEGQTVEFDAAMNDRGPIATNIVVIYGE